MAKRIVWSKEALADRIQILDYWYQRLGSKDYPTKLDDTFRNTIQLLSRFPDLGRKLKNQEERFFVKNAYQIFYLEDDETITILHIWDTRRDPKDVPL